MKVHIVLHEKRVGKSKELSIVGVYEQYDEAIQKCEELEPDNSYIETWAVKHQEVE
jgi:hypothetical protein